MPPALRRASLLALLAAALLGCVHTPDSARGPHATASGPISNATPLDEVARRDGVHRLDPDSPAPLLDQAVAELAKTDPDGRWRGVTYELTKDNALPRDWIVQTPDVWGRPGATVGWFPLQCSGNCEPDFELPFCSRDSDCAAPGATCGRLDALSAVPALAGKKLCLGHSDARVDRYYEVVAGARQAVDITVLQPPPDVRFLAALRNGITALARSHRPVTVRILVGEYPPDFTDAKALLGQLVRNANGVSGARLTVYAAAMESCGGTPDCDSFSWNHSKIVAADGRTALVGGINQWTKDYLLDQPVHDLSMELHGGGAAAAHRFADALWEFVCDHHDGKPGAASAFVYRSDVGGIGPGCQERIWLPRPAPGPGHVAVLATARLASGITTDFANQDDLARDLLFTAARHSIVAAQQDIGFILPGKPATLYPELTLRDWAEFLLAGRGDVYLVLSNYGAEGAGKSGYSNGIKLEDVAKKFLAVVQATGKLPLADAVDTVCRHFHLAPLRFGTDATWPGGYPIAQHSKFWMVDDRYFYIGSDNLYPVDLQEFGYIIDDRAAAAELRRNYWDRLWHWSREAAISGDDAPGCVLRAAAATRSGPN